MLNSSSQAAKIGMHTGAFCTVSGGEDAVVVIAKQLGQDSVPKHGSTKSVHVCHYMNVWTKNYVSRSDGRWDERNNTVLPQV
jgi:hypothetical protein